MTMQELEKDVEKLRIRLTLLEGCLMQNTSLPILGPMKNWDDYKKALDQALAKVDQ